MWPELTEIKFILGVMTFSFTDNDTSVACDKQSVCPGEPVNCACATGSSNTLAWVIDRLEFRSDEPLLTRRSIDAFGILTNKHNDNRIQVLTSNLTVTASTDDANLLIQCENVDGSTLNAVPVSILRKCTKMKGINFCEDRANIFYSSHSRDE